MKTHQFIYWGYFQKNIPSSLSWVKKHALIVDLTYPNETHYFRGSLNDAIRVKIC